MSQARGRLIAFEGIDGCGKSTQSRRLAERLGALLTREPGGSSLGAAIRSIVLGGGTIDSRAEALLMLADRAQHVAEVIEPALADGRWVVTDRYSASTIAYQGYGRGLDPAELSSLCAWAAHGLHPDLYVLVDVPYEIAVGRRGNRKGASEIGGPTRDRMESEPASFHEAVSRGFAEMAAGDPERWAVVDGCGSVGAVAERVLAAVEKGTGGVLAAAEKGTGGVLAAEKRPGLEA